MPIYKNVSMKKIFEKHVKESKKLNHTFPNKLKNKTTIHDGEIFVLEGEEKIIIARTMRDKLYKVDEIKELINEAQKNNCKIFIVFEKPDLTNTQINGFYLIKPLRGFEDFGYAIEEIKTFGGIL